MRCRISATAAMLSASRRRTAITSSLLWGRGWGKRGQGARQGLGDGGSGGVGTLHSASACLRRLSLSCVCSPLFCAARYCSFSCSAARSASTRFSRLRWMWSCGRMRGGHGLAEGPTPGAGFPPRAGLVPPASRAPPRAAAALDPQPAPGPRAAARSSARPAARPGPASAGTPSSGHRGIGGPAGRGRRSVCAGGPEAASTAWNEARPHLPGVRELLQLQLQLPRRGHGLTLPNLERLQLLLKPSHVVLVGQRAVPLRGEERAAATWPYLRASLPAPLSSGLHRWRPGWERVHPGRPDAQRRRTSPQGRRPHPRSPG